MKRGCFIFFCLLNVYCGFSQTEVIDSLKNILQNAKTDSAKVKILNDLFLEYEFTDEPVAREYLNKALELSLNADYKKGLRTTYIHLGFLAEDRGHYQEALGHYRAALTVSQELSDKKAIASAYNSIGAVYYHQGNYPEALKNYFASLKIREEIGDQRGIASAYNNIGIIYVEQGNYTEALKNYRASLKIKETLGDKKGIASAYTNIGLVFYNQGDYTEALKNYVAGLEIYENSGDRSGLAAVYNNIGGLYSQQAETILNPVLRAGKLELSLKNHFASLKIKESAGDKAGIASSYGNIGNVYMKQKKYKDAEMYFVRSEKLAKEIGHKEYLKETYSSLTNLDSAIGNFKAAYHHHKQYILYRDSLENEETRKRSLQSQMTYEFEKKEAVAKAEHKIELENQQKLASEKSRKQKIIIAFVLGGLLLVLVFAVFIFRSLHITRKQKTVIEDQKKLVEDQKNEVEEQKSIIEEKQKEIIDSIMYARRIQRSLLPTQRYIEQTLNRLKK